MEPFSCVGLSAPVDSSEDVGFGDRQNFFRRDSFRFPFFEVRNANEETTESVMPNSVPYLATIIVVGDKAHNSNVEVTMGWNRMRTSNLPAF